MTVQEMVDTIVIYSHLYHIDDLWVVFYDEYDSYCMREY